MEWFLLSRDVPVLPRPQAILSGEGSFRHGGRWNAPGSFRAVYGSTDDMVAVKESRANADYYGIPYPFVHPRLLVAIEFQVKLVLDLGTLPPPFPFHELATGEDWRKLQAAGRESVSQPLGRAAYHLGAEVLLAPSARVAEGTTVVYFPKNLRRASRVRVCEAEELENI